MLQYCTTQIISAVVTCVSEEIMGMVPTLKL